MASTTAGHARRHALSTHFPRSPFLSPVSVMVSRKAGGVYHDRIIPQPINDDLAKPSSFDKLRTGPFDKLRTGSFDKLRTGSFDKLRTGPFDKLRMTLLFQDALVHALKGPEHRSLREIHLPDPLGGLLKIRVSARQRFDGGQYTGRADAFHDHAAAGLCYIVGHRDGLAHQHRFTRSQRLEQ
jgi:hypothetical protein